MKFPRRFRNEKSLLSPLAIDPRALSTEFSAETPNKTETIEDIAIVSICGPLEHHRSGFWDSYDEIICRIEEAFKSDARVVVICIDSPGGDASGATETNRKIRRLKKKHGKKLYAYSNESMYSAAYSIGCAADEIWVPDTGGVGSVGVICALLDKTEQNKLLGLNIKLVTSGSRKADGQEDRELTEDVIEVMQERVDHLADVFFDVVAKSRGMSPKDVAALEAGVFLGQNAVESGLADKVGGWYKFIQYVCDQIADSESRDSGTGEPNMKTRAQLKEARDKAAQKLAKAKSDSDRATCMKSYETAVVELASFEAKTKYVKKTEERLTEDNDEEEEEEESEEDEEEEESESSESDDEDDEDDEDDDEEEESKSKSKTKTKSMSASNLSKKVVDRVLSLAATLTGSDDPSEVAGALEGMNSRLRNQSKLETRLNKIETSDKKSRVTSMLAKAKEEGRVSPSAAKGLFEAGMKDPKWLKGYLSSMPKVVRSSAEAVHPDLSAPSQTLELQNLTTDQKKMIRQAADSAGMSVSDYMGKIKETRENRLNGSAPVGRE